MAKALECLLKLIAMYNEYMSLSTLFKRRQRSQLTEGERGNYSLIPGSQDPRTPLLPLRGSKKCLKNCVLQT